ncbi:uncharacterized protein [Ptychodera flava]|uniref:uncharacterized protein n=1 Tax=Ptychodera flava TaxID=63121 RepID=UPI003969E521
MGNSHSGVDPEISPIDPHRHRRPTSTKDLQGPNTTGTASDITRASGVSPHPAGGKVVVPSGGAKKEIISTASNTDRTLIVAIKSGLIKDNHMETSGITSAEVDIPREVTRRESESSTRREAEASVRDSSHSHNQMAEKPDRNSRNGLQRVSVDEQNRTNNTEHPKVTADETKLEGISPMPPGKLGNLQPYIVDDPGTSSTDSRLALLREDRGIQHNADDVAGTGKPSAKDETRHQNGSARPMLDGREVLSMLQRLEDEKLKLQHENKALKTIIEDMTSRYLPDYSRGRNTRPVSMKIKGDPREMVKQYLELYNREWATARRQLEQLSPLGGDTKFQKYHLQFLCDVFVFAFTITRRAVHEFEDRLTSLLLNGVHYPVNRTQEEGALRRRAVALYSSVIDSNPELKAAFKGAGDTSAGFLKQLLQKCPLDDVMSEVCGELKKEWPSALQSSVEENKEIRQYIEKSCRVAFQMNILRPHIEISHKEKQFRAVHHDPGPDASPSSIQNALIDFHIWPTLLDASNNILVKGRVRLL